MGAMGKAFIRYVSFSILGMLGSAGTILADTMFVSNKLGTEGLAALNIAISVFGLVNGVGMLFGVGGATRYAVLKAQGQEEHAHQTFMQALWAELAFGIVFVLTGLWGATYLAQALGAGPELLGQCAVYLKTILCFAPFFLLNHLLMAFLRNDGKPKQSMLMMLCGSAANVVLDYLFIFPWNMGLFGAALATGLSPVISLCVAAVFLRRGKQGFHLARPTWAPGKLRLLMGPGLSAFINELSSGLVLAVLNWLMLKVAGNTGVAAYGIVANLALMVLAVFSGISLGIQPLISRAYGSGRHGEAARLYQMGQGLVLLTGAGVWIAACAAAPTLVSWFNGTKDALLQTLAEEGMRIYFTGFLFVGCNYMTAAFLSATEGVRSALHLSVFRGCVGIIATATAFTICFGRVGLWVAFPAVELAALLFWTAHRRPWRVQGTLRAGMTMVTEG